MKVKLINDNWVPGRRKWAENAGYVFPRIDVEYTVREVVEPFPGNEGYLLEEIVNSQVKFDNGRIGEIGFNVEKFEILLPDDVMELINQDKLVLDGKE